MGLCVKKSLTIPLSFGTVLHMANAEKSSRAGAQGGADLGRPKLRRKRHAPDPETMTVPVAVIARKLGLSMESVYAAIRNREIPGVRVGQRYLVAKDVLDRLLRQAGVEVES